MVEEKILTGTRQNDENLNDLLQELRILLQGAQVLTAFLIILPFNSGFSRISSVEKWVYLATFLCSIVSLILFSTPAAQHRIQRPVHDKKRFKKFSTYIMIAGITFLSLALILATQLVINEVAGFAISTVATAFVSLVILLFWWLLPILRKG